MSMTFKILIAVMWIFAGLMVADAARAERIKDLASVAGVRNNQLVGYGLVVGLDGSGDQTTQTPFTVQSIVNMLSNLGVTLPPGTSLQLKNVAAVMVTANLPPFARAGQQIDITVSSIGNAKSLKGGTLVLTPLKGADGQVYALAQGNLVVNGAGASGGGSKVTINHLSVGRVAGGATVEREVPTLLGGRTDARRRLRLRAHDRGDADRDREQCHRPQRPLHGCLRCAGSTTRPSSISTMRSPRSKMRLSWVTITIARPSSARRRNSDTTLAPLCESSAAVGSSASTTAGSAASARAMATRWRCPPDSCAG